jgi:hypothetical protein
MKPLFKIDESVYNSNDDRAKLIIEKGISHQDFLKLIDSSDPFVVKNGTLYFIPEEKSKENVKKFIEQRKAYLEKFGDIAPIVLLKNEGAITKIYPELKDVYAEVKAKIESENCSACAANRHAEKILKELVKLPFHGRDLSSLSFIGELGLKVLRKEKIEIDASKIEVPLHITKVYREEKKTIERNTDAHPMQCLLCAMEHMGKAAENYREYLKGYDGINHKPNHLPLAFGNIAEAECQTVVSWPVLAEKIRNLKLEMRENLRIPTDEMLDKICEVFWLVLEAYDPAGRENENCGCKGK